MKRFLRNLTTGAVAAVMVAALMGGTAVAANGRSVLVGSVPSWARASAFKGAANSRGIVDFRVYLGLRDAAGAAALASAVSNPRSSSYGHYLTPVQFRQRFSPTEASVNAVKQWLRSQGFAVGYTPTNNVYISAEGTVAQASRAFGTSFGEYAVQGQILRSPRTALTIPVSLAGTVSGVIGLDDGANLVQPLAKPAAAPPAVFVNAGPCSSYFGEKTTATDNGPDGTTVPNIYGTAQPWAPCGYTAAQMRGAYGVPNGLVGTGVTVAIIDAYASPTIVQDVNTWSTRQGIPTFKPGQFRQVTPPGVFNRPENPAQYPQEWSGEETLDIEAVHGMAPNADIVYVGAPNNYRDLDGVMNKVVNGHLADMVTNSYGYATEALPPGYIIPVTAIYIQAAAEGIGVYFSSGDSPVVSWSASSPWVTAVGGTSLAVGNGNTYQYETGWETGRSVLQSDGTWNVDPPGSFLYGSGGGTSQLFRQPSYQAGVVPASLSKANNPSGPAMRVVPDVAAVGDPNTGFLIGQTQTFPDGSTAYSEYRIGGTSLSSPLFTGMMADLQQGLGHDIGFANPYLYETYQAHPTAFHDVQHVANTGVVRPDFKNYVDASSGYTYSFRSFDFTTNLSIHTTPGYDTVTGLGSINGSVFFP